MVDSTHITTCLNSPGNSSDEMRSMNMQNTVISAIKAKIIAKHIHITLAKPVAFLNSTLSRLQTTYLQPHSLHLYTLPSPYLLKISRKDLSST